MLASIIHTDIFANHAATYLSLPFVFHIFGIFDFVWLR